MNNFEIYISYAWEPMSIKLANDIIHFAAKNNIHIKRDKSELGYKGNIKEFMQKIGKSKAIIVLISDKYLKSENCMFEMYEIYRNMNIWNRIFPIVLKSAEIYEETKRIDYLIYWDSKVDELENKIKSIKNSIGNVKVYEKINQYADIRRVIDEIADMLRDMNTLSLDKHNELEFDSIFNEIEKYKNLEKHEEYKNTDDKEIDMIKSYVSKGKIKNAISLILKISKNTHLEQDALITSSEYKHYEDSIIKQLTPKKSYSEVVESIMIITDKLRKIR